VEICLGTEQHVLQNFDGNATTAFSILCYTDSLIQNTTAEVKLGYI